MNTISFFTGVLLTYIFILLIAKFLKFYVTTVNYSLDDKTKKEYIKNPVYSYFLNNCLEDHYLKIEQNYKYIITLIIYFAFLSTIYIDVSGIVNIAMFFSFCIFSYIETYSRSNRYDLY